MSKCPIKLEDLAIAVNIDKSHVGGHLRKLAKQGRVKKVKMGYWKRA